MACSVPSILLLDVQNKTLQWYGIFYIFIKLISNLTIDILSYKQVMIAYINILYLL